MADHSILILAHRAPWLFRRLVDALSGTFTVLAHVDAGADRSAFEQDGRVTVIPAAHRIRWGSYAMIAAVLDLLRHGLAHTSARTFTLISGDTYPLCSPAALAAILDAEQDCIDSHLIQPTSETMQRIANVYLPDTRIGELRPGMHFLHRYLDADLTAEMAAAEQARRNRADFLRDYRYAKGAQWWSLTRATAERIMALIDEDPRFVEAFRFSAIPDEAFFQTAIAKLDLHDRIRPGLVYAKWDTVPAPYTFQAGADIALLQAQKRPLARKFGDDSGGLIQQVEDELWSRELSCS